MPCPVFDDVRSGIWIFAKRDPADIRTNTDPSYLNDDGIVKSPFPPLVFIDGSNYPPDTLCIKGLNGLICSYVKAIDEFVNYE